MIAVAHRFLALLLALTMAACTGSQPPPPPQAIAPIPAPDPARVESVLFLVGDPGDAVTDRSPTLQRLRQDIEDWAQRLEADSAVVTLILGDLIYPVGLRPPDHPAFDSDTAVFMSQVRLVQGPEAFRRGARLFFLAGNHDWGGRERRAGPARIRNLDEFVEFARATTGAAVDLVPEVGTGGPHLVDLGDRLRLILLDTAWWLLASDEAQHAEVLGGIERAMATAGDREVLIAAHHPFESVGPHGGHFPFWETFGLRYLLARSGAILQDVTSGPYRDLERGLRQIFGRLGPPLIFAGGHEHSLQVIEGRVETDPRFNLVSGSASKLTRVGYEPGVRYAASAPGYMRVVFEKDGGVILFVEATDPEYLKCRGADEERDRCVAEGVAAFGTVHSRRLR
jgi:hypothetical protein